MREFNQRDQSAPIEQIDVLIDEIRAAMLPVTVSEDQADAPHTGQPTSEYWRASIAKLERSIKDLVAATGGLATNPN